MDELPFDNDDIILFDNSSNEPEVIVSIFVSSTNGIFTCVFILFLNVFSILFIIDSILF